MEAYVKAIGSWRTIKKATVLTSDLCIDSLDTEQSTLSVFGSVINRSDVGNWLIVNGSVYLIHQVKPQDGKTVLTLLHPIDAFARLLPFAEPSAGQTIGGFVADMLQKHWAVCDDPVYALPYLTVSNSDTVAFVSPNLDNSGLFSLTEYCRLMRKTYRVAVEFRAAGDTLACTISIMPAASRQVSFSDGRSHLKSVDYAAAGVSKITAIQDGVSTTWYLSEDGEVTQEIPAQRASGAWKTISVAANANVAAKVAETFAKDRSGHKVEFSSELDMNVLDSCKFLINGELLNSYISNKGKSFADNRFHYKAGELATTASEKLRGVTK